MKRESKRNSFLLKIWYLLFSAITVFAGVLSILLILSHTLGLKVFSIPSNSMEPTYYAGTLILVKETDPYTLRKGDIITYSLEDDSVATHRIQEVIPCESNPLDVDFLTKGDLNDGLDPHLVHITDVIGVPVFHIPLLGYAASYVQTVYGKATAAAIVLVLLFFLFAPDILRKDG